MSTLMAYCNDALAAASLGSNCLFRGLCWHTRSVYYDYPQRPTSSLYVSQRFPKFVFKTGSCLIAAD